MTLNDSLAVALSALLNAQRSKKKEVVLRPLSSMLRKVLEILHDQGYLGEVIEIEDGRGGVVNVSLLGTLNKCGVVKPRFNVKIPDYDKWEKRYLPAKNFGVLIISTSKGLMTHTAAKEKRIGGSLIAYCY